MLLKMATAVKETDKYFVLNAIRKKHEASGGHNGLLFSALAHEVDIPTADLKETCNALVREKKITWHDAAQGIMFKMKS